ncbi:Hypothetical protein CINCED_3A002465 [Cinara cedri]|uniref:Uncharacterized protein n=1 Tax=Cinara cedri TaxID=506608 RepID=A0A5E4NBU9_9HEMI|nr:Hypothetical protein CINCED_3A002465 [Cinara cedri]
MDGLMQPDLPTYAEMQNILTELKHVNEQLRRQVVELQAKPVGNEQQFKVLANDETRILTINESQFRSTTKILEENKVEYHRYQLKSEKPFRVVLRGINHDSDIGIITNELYD